MTSGKMYVVVSYPADWYFEDNSTKIDSWISRYMRLYKIEETGSGMGFGYRDVDGEAPSKEIAKAFKEDISNYYRIKVKLYDCNDEFLEID